VLKVQLDLKALKVHTVVVVLRALKVHKVLQVHRV
jgi:hypothetical protein